MVSDYTLHGGLGGADDPLGHMTEGLGHPLRPVKEASVASFGASIDGTGAIEDDVNAMNFTGHEHADPLTPTALYVAPADVVTFSHNLATYMYMGPRDVSIGVGGSYTTFAADYSPLGTGDHTVLANLDATDQHPITAITGLVASQDAQDQNLVSHINDLNPHPQYLEDTVAKDTFTAAGYGNIQRLNDLAMGTIGGGWHELDFEGSRIAQSKNVTQDFPNNGMVINQEGIWAVSFIITLSFTEVNAGRRLKVRLYNATELVAAEGLTFGVGRNQGVVTLSGSIILDVPAGSVGDLFTVEVGGADTFDAVNLESAEYNLYSVGLFPGAL